MRTWTAEEVRSLGVRTDLVTACEIVYGCGRTKAYELLAAGELDFPVLRAGARIAIPVRPLLELLGLTKDQPDPGAESTRPSSHSDPSMADNVRFIEQRQSRAP